MVSRNRKQFEQMNRSRDGQDIQCGWNSARRVLQLKPGPHPGRFEMLGRVQTHCCRQWSVVDHQPRDLGFRKITSGGVEN